MQAYITHLIEDIRAAHRPVPPAVLSEYKDSHERFEDYIEEVERYMYEDPTLTLSEHCGLEHHIFPPADRLTDEQVLQVSEAFAAMLYTYNVYAHFPEKAPVRICYPHLIDLLSTKMFVDQDGFSNYNFCDYHPPTCPFGEWCSCKDLDDDMDAEVFNADPGALPF